MLNKLTNNWRIFLKIFLTSLLLLGNLQLAIGKDTPSSAYDRNQYKQFDVGKYLSVDSESPGAEKTGTQKQAYLQTENPVAAFILQMINLISLTAASLSFLAVVVAGFIMMSSVGNESQINRGKEILTRALVGLVLTLSAYFIVSFVQSLFFETAPK